MEYARGRGRLCVGEVKGGRGRRRRMRGLYEGFNGRISYFLGSLTGGLFVPLTFGSSSSGWILAKTRCFFSSDPEENDASVESQRTIFIS